MNLDEAAAFFKENDDFILTSHVSPDADGLGAEYALLSGLLACGKRARAVNADSYSQKYTYIDEKGIIENLAASKLADTDISSHTVILIDTNDIQFAGEMADVVLGKAKRIIIFDHHESSNIPGEFSCSLSSMSSTCEMVYGILVRLGVEITLDIAVALFSGIVFDTGSFSYAKTTSGTFNVALELTKAGVKPSYIHAALYESSTISMLMLHKNVLSTLELHDDRRIAVQTMTKAILDESGATYEESEDLINLPLQSKSIQVSIFIKEDANGTIRCSMRSKGKVNVAQIAQTFGGGGHKTAAGFRSPFPLDAIKEKMITLCATSLNQTPA